MPSHRTILRVERLEDRCTPANFGNPWPDAAHLSLSFAPDNTQLGNQASNLFQKLNALAPTKTWQQEILRAFQTWAVQANINLWAVSDNGLPFGTSGAIQGDPRFGDIRLASCAMPPNTDEAGAVTFEADAGTWAGDTVLNSAASLGMNGNGQYDLFSVMLHEAGHVFGLDHSSDPMSVMFPNYAGVRTGLSASDVAALQSLYGVRVADSYEGLGGNEQLGTATRLNPVLNLDGTVAATANGDVTTLQDRDVFAFSTLLTTGTVIITLRTAGVSLLTPRVTVYDAQGNVVDSAVTTDPVLGGFIIRLDHVKPLSKYYVKVESGQQNVFGIGTYQLTVSFLSSSLLGSLTSTVTYGLSALRTATTDDLHTNDTFLTASLLPQLAARTDSRFDYAYQANISDRSDVDFYKIKAPAANPGVDTTMTAMVWGSPNGLVPRLRVFDAQQQPVAAEVLVNADRSYTIQVRHVVPQASYYVQVVAANPRGANYVGDYFLGVDFSPATVELTNYVSGTLTDARRDGFAAVTLTREQLFHFVLSASTPNSNVAATVQMTITDATGRVVFSLVGDNNEPVSRNVLLGPGSYSVRFSAAPTSGNVLPTLNYLLRGERLITPIGPEAGDGSNDPSNPFTAVKQNATVSLSSSVNASHYSQDVTFTASVAASGTQSANGPGGSVVFYDNGTNIGSAMLAGGIASLTVSYLGTGDHSITAAYQGDSNYNAAASSPLTQTVVANDTTTTLSAGASSSYFTQDVTITAVVNPSGTPVSGPTGTVIFYDNGSTLAYVDLTNGVAALTVNNLSAGSHTITAEYVGDGIFNGSASGNSLNQVVLANDTTISLTTSAPSTLCGQDATFTATVRPDNTPLGGPAGSVAFYDNGTCLAYMPLTNGVATFTCSNLGVGTHTITAGYLGDSTFSPSSSAPLTQTVSTNNCTMGLSSSATSSYFTQDVTFTVTLTSNATSGSQPTGWVEFHDGEATLGSVQLTDNTASLTLSSLGVGAHNITAVYLGNVNFNGTSSDAFSQTVLANNTTISLTSAATSSTYGQAVTFTATVTPNGTPLTGPTGRVSFYDNGTFLGVMDLTDGATSITFDDLSVGDHTITAVYEGDSTFSASTCDPLPISILAN